MSSSLSSFLCRPDLFLKLPFEYCGVVDPLGGLAERSEATLGGEVGRLLA